MADERRDQEEFNRAVVEKIESEPDFLGHLLENRELAFRRAGLFEMAEALQEQVGRIDDGDDVEGHRGGWFTYYRTCGWRRYPYKYHTR